jgi:hypothetical protein
MRTASLIRTLAASIVLTSASAVVAGPLPTDVNALDGGVPTTWQGTQAFFALPPVGVGQLSANVEYAVYAPGKFGLSFGPLNDPSGGTHYVYAYQIYNTAVGAGARSISTLTVGLDGNELPANPGFLGAALGLAPSGSSLVPAGPPSTSARWSYTGTLLAPGGNSEVLIFTSPYGPEKESASLIGGITNAQQLPSPVPEPATLVLVGIGAMALIGAYRRRSI